MHIKRSVLAIAMLVSLQIPAFAEELPFGGKTVVAPSEGSDGLDGSESSAELQKSQDLLHANPRTGGAPKASDEIRAEDVFGGSIVMIDTKIPLSSNSFAALSTEKYDISLPSRMREQFSSDYEFCLVLLDAINGKEYEYDLRTDELSFDLGSAVGSGLIRLREDCIVTALPSQTDGSSDSTAESAGLNAGIEGLEESSSQPATSDLRSKLRKVYKATLPFRESSTRVFISVSDLDSYLQDVGGTVDSDLLSIRFLVGNAKGGWDIDVSKMKATVKDKLSRYERQDEGNSPTLPSVDGASPALTFVRWDDLRRPTGLTPDQLKPALSGVLGNYADFVAYCERTYGVNAAFINAVAQSECGAGTAGYGLSSSRCNLFSIRTSNGAYKDYRRDASSVDEAYRNSIEDFCALVSKAYLNSSGVYWGGSPTSYGVSKFYAESPTWADAIENARQEFYSKIN